MRNNRRLRLMLKNGMRKTVGMLAAGLFLLSSITPAVRAEAEAVSSNMTISGQEAADLFEVLSSGKMVAKDVTYAAPEKPTVYLTFDDGPSKLTERVLDILKQEQIQATFFVLGQMAEQRKNVISRMAEEGHAIGNHTYNHVYKELYSDFASFLKQVRITDAVLESITGAEPYLLRAPGGTSTNFDAFYFYYLEQAGYRIFDWNVDSRDAVRKGVPAEEIVATVKGSPLKRELVVLMHDGIGHEETVKALPEIIAYYREQGYVFAPLRVDVTPVQFSLAKSKWASRNYTVSGFQAELGEAVEGGLARNTQLAEDRKRQLQLAQQIEEAREEAAAALALMKSDTPTVAAGASVSSGTAQTAERDVEQPPLTVRFGNVGEWSLPADQYGFDHSRFSVPLRGYIEKLGGLVRWDEAKRLAIIQYGALRLEVDPARGLIREMRPGRPLVTRHLSDIAWVQGVIRVPLRGLTGLFGEEIAGYALEEKERRVELSIRGKPQMITGKFSFAWQP